MASDLKDSLDVLYNTLDGSEVAEAYSHRHGINSAAILTITDDVKAAHIADFLADRVRGKTVVEIGGGIGLLALHLSAHASKVLVIEANPAWTLTFLPMFYAAKPKNVTWVFGAADEVAGQISGDVAYFCTHSDHDGMARTAAMFAPVVIDVYRELFNGLTSEEFLRNKIATPQKGNP